MLKRKITKSEEGQKVIKYLLRISDASKVFLYKLIRKRKIFVNNFPVSKEYIIKKDDEIFCDEINEIKEIYKGNKLPDIIFEDNDVIVVDKKAGELIYGEENSIINSLKTHLKASFLVPVHRIDKYTEGVVIFALSYEKAKKLTELFSLNRINKYYEAIICGNLEKDIFVEAIIVRGKDESISKVLDYKIYRDIPDKRDFLSLKNKKSATIIRPKKVVNNKTIVEIEIWTGHHHQIRAVSSAIGYPVAGDLKYGAPKDEKYRHYQLLCKRIEIPELNLIFESRKNLELV